MGRVVQLVGVLGEGVARLVASFGRWCECCAEAMACGFWRRRRAEIIHGQARHGTKEFLKYRVCSRVTIFLRRQMPARLQWRRAVHYVARGKER
jgi:hypothetical protein